VKLLPIIFISKHSLLAALLLEISESSQHTSPVGILPSSTQLSEEPDPKKTNGMMATEKPFG
jgi:hypothetical protein